MLYPVDVAGESLQNFGDDDSRGGKRLRLGDHPVQFSASTTGRGAEEIDPDRAIHQDQTRFLREPFKSPFQIPLPVVAKNTLPAFRADQ